MCDKRLGDDILKQNIRHTLRNSIFNAFAEGAQKKEIKDRDPEEAYGKIFSYGTKFQLLDRVNDFVKYLPKDVKNISDITKEHVKNYLEEKSEICSQQTLNEYRSELKKIGFINHSDWGVEKVGSLKTALSNRGVEAVISKEDFSKILDYAEKKPCASAACIKLEALIGVRVSDLCYGIEIVDNGKTLKIESKNKKYAYRHITAEIQKILDSEEFQKMIKDSKVIAPKDGSVNKWLNRVEDRLGIQRNSFHNIRRRIAQDKYDEFRHMGLSKRKTCDLVSKWLNHWENRDRLLKNHYISNMW